VRKPTADAGQEALQRLLWAVALRWPCHQMTSRSFIVRNRQMPLCARCFGLLGGPILAPLMVVCAPAFVPWVCVGLFLLDGLTQLAGWRTSTNWLRFGTGAVCSASVVKLLWSAFYA